MLNGTDQLAEAFVRAGPGITLLALAAGIGMFILALYILIKRSGIKT